MRTVILDGYTLNPGDLSWGGFEKLGCLQVYERTSKDLVFQRADGADFVLTNKTRLEAEILRQLKRLRYIGVLATGYNCVDVQVAKELGITVTNIPAYGTYSVAQFTFALILELCHQLKVHSDAVRQGSWSQSKDWCFWRTPMIELAGKTLGIIGFGRIGRQVATIARAMGMRVIAVNRSLTAAPLYDGFRWVTLDQLFVESDVVTLHCPLLPETEGLINSQRLGLMKSSALLINTSRGALVTSRDLADALNSGKVAGAAVDVLCAEPPANDDPLLSAKNCLITPHIAWATQEARSRLIITALLNLVHFLRGSPQNVVS